MQRERRWVILAEDGRHVTVGRDIDPSDEEVKRAGDGLRAMAIGGWLVVLEGHYHQPRSRLVLLMVREIAPCSGAGWSQAESAFLRIRDDAMRAA